MKKALIPPHPLTNFEIKEYYENDPRFNGIYSRDNFAKKIKSGTYVINLDEYADVIKSGAYVINPDEYADVGTHWVALYVKDNEFIYIDSIGVEHVPKEIKKFIGHKNIKANRFEEQADNSIMCGYFCIGFIDFMFAGKSLIDYTSLFSPYGFKENDNIILSYFK